MAGATKVAAEPCSDSIEDWLEEEHCLMSANVSLLVSRYILPRTSMGISKKRVLEAGGPGSDL